MKKRFYLVGKFIGLTAKGPAWKLCGIFDTKDKADRICCDARYFYIPIKVNYPIDDGPATFEGIVWPAKGIKPGGEK